MTLRAASRLLCAAAAGGFLALCAASAAPVTPDTGHKLYTGQDPRAAGGRLSRFACHSCHGRDGEGGVEGNVPGIAGKILQAPADLRPAYDLASFGAALREGIHGSGRGLSRIMPRYDLSDAEVSALWGYLGDLPQRQRMGVTASEVTFGVVIDADRPDIGLRYVQGLHAALARALPSGTVHGRAVRIIAMRAPVAQADTVIAALAMPPGQGDVTGPLTAAGLPVLFSLGALTGSEDPSIQRSFMPTQRDVNGAIAQHLSTTPARRIALLAEAGRAEALARMIRLSMPQAEVWRILDPSPEGLTQGAPDAIVDLLGLPLEAAPTGTILYHLASHGALVAAPDGHPRFVVIEAPALVQFALDVGSDPIAAQAGLAARVLSEALIRAGRDLTRTRLVSVLGQVSLGPEGLDYARLPLSGTDYVQILPLLQRHADR